MDMSSQGTPKQAQKKASNFSPIKKATDVPRSSK